jgi:hypothetical protein
MKSKIIEGKKEFETFKMEIYFESKQDVKSFIDEFDIAAEIKPNLGFDSELYKLVDNLKDKLKEYE